ncbi:hypothetical protein THAOC_11697 [Thalassiosira oceanica]|uniref:Uncharacterized protein n=1 Tax=Thalassiosira oceanica TaxID=159749 RepID=K0T212_THAOC|nr:hypothetical protein THAOC_11697 [Thalassiosira oceanica]|eukprot:EJK67296.1 hypothetical protein THAOC_11697 [Thalassiosira oceanica]
MLPRATIISAVRSLCFFVYNYGTQWPRACEILKAVGAVAVSRGAKDSELPAIVGMIRSYGDQAASASSTVCSVDELQDTIPKLLWGGCVDELVMRELVKLRDTCPEFVATCLAPILCGDQDVLSDSRFAGALRSGLFASALSICRQLRQQDVRIPIARRGGVSPAGVGADVIAAVIVERLYKIRLHRKTHKVLGSMTPFNYWGLDNKLEHIFHDAQESVCANCLETFDGKALKWCKGTPMLEPFCSRECLKESWTMGECADFGDVAEEGDDKRSKSLRRNVLQAGSKVLRDRIGRIVREHGPGMERGQGLTISVDLREFPPRITSRLLSRGEQHNSIQVTFAAEDFRGFRDGVVGRPLIVAKQGSNFKWRKLSTSTSSSSKASHRLESRQTSKLAGKKEAEISTLQLPL